MIRRPIVFVLLLLLTLQTTAQTLPRLIPYRDGDKWGYSDTAANVKIAAQWDAAEFFCGDKAVVIAHRRVGVNDEAIYGLIDTAGRYIIPLSMNWSREWAGRQQTTFNADDGNGHYGLVDTNGAVVIPLIYDRPKARRPTLSPEYHIAWKNGRAGIINPANKTMLPFEYDDIQDVSITTDNNPVFIVQQGGLYGIIDLQGKKLLPAQYTEILRQPDTGLRNGLRAGFSFYQRPAVKPGATAADALTGWMDYPGTVLIPPRHRYIFWLTRDYFSDDRLYDARDKAVFPKSYTNFFRSNDTLFAQRVLKKNKRGQEFAQYAFRLTDLERISVSKQWCPAGTAPRFYCGYSSYMRDEAEKRENARPYVRINGEYVHRFEKNGYHWVTQIRLPQRYAGVTGWKTGEDHQAYRAIADSNGRIISRIFSGERRNYYNYSPGMGTIAGYSAQHQLIIWNRDTSFAVSDLSGILQIDYQPYTISDVYRMPQAMYFARREREKKKWREDHPVRKPRKGEIVMDEIEVADVYRPQDELYFVRSQPAPRRHRKYDDEPMEMVEAGAQPRLCYSEYRNGGGGLSPVAALRQYDFQFPVDGNLQQTRVFTGTFCVKDSLGKTGFVNLDGEVLQPALSFRFRKLEPVTRNVFRARDSREYNAPFQLLDSAGRELLPGIEVTDARLLKDRSHSYPQPPFTNNTIEDTRLIQIRYRKKGENDRLFYMSAEGLPYTANR